MSIKPFVDAPAEDVGNAVSDPWANAKQAAIDSGQLAATGAMDTSEIDRFRQGVNTRGPSDFVVSMLPWMSDRGFPDNASERFDPTIERNVYGQPKLFEDLGNSGPFNGRFSPFDDIAGVDDPVAFIKDPGTQRYPIVLLSPNWLDPASMDGIIEPLAIRESLTNASIGGPWVAHDIRASLQPTVGPEILGTSLEISTFIPFEPIAAIRPYFDAQDSSMGAKPRPLKRATVTWVGIASPYPAIRITAESLNTFKFTVQIVNAVVDPPTASETEFGGLIIAGDLANAVSVTATDFSTVIDALPNYNSTVVTAGSYTDADDAEVLQGIPPSFTGFVSMQSEGSAFPEPAKISPFNDIDGDDFNTTDIDFNSFELSGSFMSTGKFIDDPRFGTLGKCATVGFISRGGNYVVNDDISGNRRVNGVDSIAFAGWLK